VRKIGTYLLANPFHAMAAALVCAILPLVAIPGGFLAAVLVGFITLCRGYKTGLLVLAGVAIPVIIVAIWKQTVLFDVVLLRCILVWLLACILRSTVSWRLTLETMTILGILTVIGFHLALGDVSGWWSTILERYQAFLTKVLGGQVTEDRIQEMIKQVIPIATGLFAAIMLLGAFCQLLLARWWQAALFRPGGLAKEFVEIRAGLIIAAVFTIGVIGALFGWALAIDLLPVLILPLTINGLSLLHKWARFNKKIVYLLVAVYIGLIFLPMVLIMVLALAGYVDSGYDFRKRYFTNHLPKKGG
jgi:hypothetical protein